MKSSILRGAAAAFAAVLMTVISASAQSAPRTLTGTVLLDDEPVASVPVTLHRVTAEESGPIGTQVSDSEGRFSFTLPAPDTTAFEVFLVTAEYHTVRYFGPPVHGGVVPADYSVTVHDTTSVLPGAIRVARRDLVLLPETTGGWEANEIIRLHNSADRTLVSADGMPTWEMRLPAGATDFQAGEGDLTASEVVQMGDRVLLLSSILPGDRELFIRYRIPPDLGEAVLPIGMATDTFHVFVGQPSPSLQVDGMATTKVVEVQDQQFVQYGVTGLEDGSEITLRWEAPFAPPVSPEVAGASAALLVLLVGSWFAARARSSRRSTAPATPAAG